MESTKVGGGLREMLGKQEEMENLRQGCSLISHRGDLI